ncbi:hypothetical protein [Aestuariispira insulae]|uniref:Exonuclease n=1 Tax=Aestuariispira insulae TaxID=1461337 RepID=A0A3D9H690_9PROT|nr:hypothetical protein [Aestuariispira insulae]RED45025.1 hypothetical protein DFP90_11216 [Aestuariispira insulae]
MKISFPDNLGKITFVDLEASSLYGGWPIELGFAHLFDDGTIQSGAWLIYPDQDWVEDWDYWTGWSLESETIHGISKELLLDQGIAAQKVVEHFEAEIAETLLVSDAPAYDQGWIRQPALIINRFCIPFRLSRPTSLE